MNITGGGADDKGSYVQVIFDSSDPANIGTRDNPQFIMNPAIENAEGLYVSAVQIPFSYYAMDITNNTFDVTIPSEGSTNYSLYRVFIPPGTHKASDFPTMFANVLTIEYNVLEPWNGGVRVTNFGSATGAFDDLSTKYDLILYFYGATSKVTIYSGAGGTSGTTQFRVNFAGETSIKDFLGFPSSGPGANNGVYTAVQDNIYDENDALISNVFFIESLYSVQLNGPGTIYIDSNIAQTIGNGAVRTSRTINSLLYGIDVNSNYPGIITFQNPSDRYMKFTRTSISAVSFKLTLGQRTRYCAGADSTYFSAGGAPIFTDFLQLQGLPFKIEIKFYHNFATSIAYNLTSFGDRLVTTESQHEGSRLPHHTQSGRMGTGILPESSRRSKRPKGSARKEDRITSYPYRK